MRSMEYDSSDTDDDVPPQLQNRFRSGMRPAGNGRAAVATSAPIPRISDMEIQIHNVEQEAYRSVLRAFKAQSDAITWEKESLITELRKELRVSDEEHRELLSRVNNDDMIRRIREWRKTSGPQSGMPNNAQPGHDRAPSPSVSASRKKQKTSQSVASLSMGAPSPTLHPPMQASTSSLRRGPPPPSASRNKKPQMQYPSTGIPETGRGQVANRASSGPFPPHEAAAPGSYDPLVGRRVWTRWPEDNSFYEALITDYKPEDGKHALVYDIHTADETWEWVDLKEIPPGDIRWEGDEPSNFRKGGRPGPGRENKKSMMRAGAGVGPPGRGRGTMKGSKKEVPLSQNGAGRRAVGDIEILHTDTLIKEVEKVFGANFPDPMEIEKAKKVLEDHEHALVDAIARLEDASDGESGNT
ncbi:Protein EMSY-LIKE 3 [Linum perenne]